MVSFGGGGAAGYPADVCGGGAVLPGNAADRKAKDETTKMVVKSIVDCCLSKKTDR